MKLAIFPITTLLIATSIAIPARADIPCQGDEVQSVCLDQTKQRRRNRRNDYYYYINQIYREVLGREVDSGGLRTYSRLLEDGESLDEVREDIANSSEARNAVERTYRELVGRGPSRNTVRDYTRRLARGWTLSDVRADIVDNDDFRGRNRGRREPIFQPPVPPPPGVGPGGRPSVPPPPPGIGPVGPGGVPPMVPPPPPGRPF